MQNLLKFVYLGHINASFENSLSWSFYLKFSFRY